MRALILLFSRSPRPTRKERRRLPNLEPTRRANCLNSSSILSLRWAALKMQLRPRSSRGQPGTLPSRRTRCKLRAVQSSSTLIQAYTLTSTPSNNKWRRWPSNSGLTRRRASNSARIPAVPSSCQPTSTPKTSCRCLSTKYHSRLTPNNPISSSNRS